MKNNRSAFSLGVLALAAASVVGGISCSQSAPVGAPPPAPSDVGRYQVVVAPEGDRGSMLFMLDTKEGKTWIYRPPQGTLGNGIWVDIPLVTYPPDYWQRVLSTMSQQPPPASSTPAAALTNAPAQPATNR